MEVILDYNQVDDNTKRVFNILIGVIEEALEKKKLVDLTLFKPTASDGFIKTCFEKRSGESFDIAYFLCMEDTSNDKQKNFKYLDDMFTTFRAYLNDENILTLDGLTITITGLMTLSDYVHTCYYLVFCLEDNRFTGIA